MIVGDVAAMVVSVGGLFWCLRVGVEVVRTVDVLPSGFLDGVGDPSQSNQNLGTFF